MQDIVLFGTGTVAEVIEVYLRAHTDYRIVGYTVDAAFRTAERHAGLPLVAWETLEAEFPPGQVRLLGPLTYRRMNTLRRDRYLEGKTRGYGFASFIHPGSHIYAQSIGENVVILEANVVQPFVTIGDNVILWTMNHIGHHSRIGDHCFIAGQAGLAGRVTLGPECYLAGKAGIGPGLTLGRGCALLNAARVTRDLPDYAVVEGERLRPFPSTRLHKLL
jgi:acetyltransferase-like isoleucine patch superfamily enzyme